jgi:uncharacterized membrane protein YgcG
VTKQTELTGGRKFQIAALLVMYIVLGAILGFLADVTVMFSSFTGGGLGRGYGGGFDGSSFGGGSSDGGGNSGSC